MDPYLLVLRFLHIVLGALWVGMMAFSTLLLAPAVRDAGTAGPEVLAALQRRRVTLIMPIIALAVLISGGLLTEHLYGGMARLAASLQGRTLLAGAVAAMIAFLVGLVVVRPATSRAAALAAVLASSPEQERAARAAQIGRLRPRGAVWSNVALGLLLAALGAMAVARYL